MRRWDYYIQYLPSRTDILVGIFLPHNALIGSGPWKLRPSFHQRLFFPERSGICAIWRIFRFNRSEDQVWLGTVFCQLARPICNKQIGLCQIIKRHTGMKIDRSIRTDAETINLLSGLFGIADEDNAL